MVDTVAEELRLTRLVRAHDRWRGREVFNLLPSENALSPTARRYLSSDLAGRYTLPGPLPFDGETLDNSYGGTRYTDEIENLADAAARRVFRAKYATVRPLSGHIAAVSALAPLLPRGSKLLAIPPEDGGYDGYAPGFLPALFGWTVRPLPAKGPGLTVHEGTALEEIRREKPQMVVLGQSFFLFPYPLKPIAEEVHRYDGLVAYDASHVLGLIAGGEFQDPLREGADLLFGSTHKSFPGPQGGLVVTDRQDLFDQIAPALVWRVFDNAHWNRIAGVAQTLLELEKAGASYAKAVVSNSQAIARSLDSLGLPLIARELGFTQSHQVLLDRPAVKIRYSCSCAELARRWERQRLITDLVGRLGLAEVTRLGLIADDMSRLADLLIRAGPRRERVGREVLAWRRRYPKLRFV